MGHMMGCYTRLLHGPPQLEGGVASEMPALALDKNALPLPISLSWPTAVQNTSCASTGMGPFQALSYTDKHLALAHQTYNELPHETAAWAYMVFVSRMAAKRNAHFGPCCKCTALAHELELAHSSAK